MLQPGAWPWISLHLVHSRSLGGGRILLAESFYALCCLLLIERRRIACLPPLLIHYSFGGCVEIDANLDVNAGATGSFFSLFDATTKVDLFQNKFEIFQSELDVSMTPRYVLQQLTFASCSNHSKAMLAVRRLREALWYKRPL
jgi:hypothetical protein